MATTVSHRLSPTQAHAIADLTGYEDADTLRWQQACVHAAQYPHGRARAAMSPGMDRMAQGLELAQRRGVTLAEDREDLSAVVRAATTSIRSTHGCSPAPVRTTRSTCRPASICWRWKSTWVRWDSCRPAAPEPAAAEEPAQNPAPTAPAPSTASWPISEAPASLNIKLKVGNMELMFTMRDVDDLKLQRRATMSLPWLTDILHGCEANLATRQQEAEEERQAQARSLDEQIAAAVAAAMKAQATRTNGQSPE